MHQSSSAARRDAVARRERGVIPTFAPTPVTRPSGGRLACATPAPTRSAQPMHVETDAAAAQATRSEFLGPLESRRGRSSSSLGTTHDGGRVRARVRARLRARTGQLWAQQAEPERAVDTFLRYSAAASHSGSPRALCGGALEGGGGGPIRVERVRTGLQMRRGGRRRVARCGGRRRCATRGGQRPRGRLTLLSDRADQTGEPWARERSRAAAAVRSASSVSAQACGCAEEGGDLLRGAVEGVDAPRAAVNDLAGELRSCPTERIRRESRGLVSARGRRRRSDTRRACPHRLADAPRRAATRCAVRWTASMRHARRSTTSRANYAPVRQSGSDGRAVGS
jgi:hypothetical protein